MIRRQISLNFETAYSLSRSLFTHFLSNQYGRLIFVGTRNVAEPRNGKGALAYTLGKSLLFKLAEILNAEARGKNIVSSVIVPSTIDTPANRQSMPGADFSGWVPPQKIAEMLCGLCSETWDPLRETVLKVYGNA
jgi:NAD(P)-dependent dehydrogenase (short-subunit alcohol dehydrogenase family)